MDRTRFLITVPHSGTRWIKHAHQKAGWNMPQDHFVPRRERRIKEQLQGVRPNQVYVQLRDPIMTFSTYCYNKQMGMKELHDSYMMMMKWVRENPEWNVTRAEDGASQYGIPDGGRRWHRDDSPLKGAIKSGNIKQIERKGGKEWLYFRDVICPDIREFFEEHGYDFWWLDGRNTT